MSLFLQLFLAKSQSEITDKITCNFLMFSFLPPATQLRVKQALALVPHHVLLGRQNLIGGQWEGFAIYHMWHSTVSITGHKSQGPTEISCLLWPVQFTQGSSRDSLMQSETGAFDMFDDNGAYKYPFRGFSQRGLHSEDF